MSLGFLIALSLALGVAAWLFFMWTVRSGQYDDPEGPKYRMLEDDEEERPSRGGDPSARPPHPGPLPPRRGGRGEG
jgi:cbb3-type cytochrome oxidase maturation protein